MTFTKDIKDAIARLSVAMVSTSCEMATKVGNDEYKEDVNRMMLELFFLTGALSANVHILGDEKVKKSCGELVERIFGDDLSRNLESLGKVWTDTDNAGLDGISAALLERTGGTPCNN